MVYSSCKASPEGTEKGTQRSLDQVEREIS
jgi:hypothetical protein